MLRRLNFMQNREQHKAEEDTAKVLHSECLKSTQELYTKQSQVEELHKRVLEEGKHGNVSKSVARDALLSQYAGCDFDKAYELLEIRLKSDNGWIAPYNPSVNLVGAENRGAVTCYIDSLLFAMFIKMDAYECMLHPSPKHTPQQKKLADLIRLWVNMVRLGMLVHVDQVRNTLDDSKLTTRAADLVCLADYASPGSPRQLRLEGSQGTSTTRCPGSIHTNYGSPQPSTAGSGSQLIPSR